MQMMPSKVLSPEDLACFEQHGYVRIPEAFLRADALAIQDSIWAQMREHGIDQNDRATWPAGAWRGLKDNASLERGIAAPRLCGAINQLVGIGSWHVPDRWGGFLISFPARAAQTWELTSQAWHWDDTLPNHFGQNNTALMVFTIYSDVQPHGGGT